MEDKKKRLEEVEKEIEKTEDSRILSSLTCEAYALRRELGLPIEG